MKKTGKFLLLALVFMIFQTLSVLASFPSVSSSKPLKCYTISTGNNTVAYNSNSTSSGKKGTIYASDELYITQINGSWVKCTYPVKNGRKEAWIPLKVVTANNITHVSFSAKTTATTYIRAGGSKYGSISKGDSCVAVAKSGSYYQIVYPISGGYKMGWVTASDYTKLNSTTPDPTPVTISEGYYTIATKINTGYILDADGAGTGNGTNVQLWQKSTQNGSVVPQQIWSIKKAGSNYYKITNYNANKSLDIANQSKEDCANVHLWEDHPSNNPSTQYWYLYKSNGYYLLKNAYTGKFLNVNGGKAGNGVNVQQYYNDNTDAVYFSLSAVSIGGDEKEPTLTTITDGYYTIATKINTGYILDADGAGTGNGTNVQLWQKATQNGSVVPQQVWNIKRVGSSKYYKITNYNANKSLDIASQSKADCANVHLWEDHSSNNPSTQYWYLYEKDGYYLLKNVYTGKFLNVNGGKAGNGINVQQYYNDNTNAVYFSFSTTSVNDNIDTDISYANYTGVDYANIGLSSKRISALNKAKDMVTIKWTAPDTFPAWCSSKGVYNTVKATDNTSSTNFEKGKTYIGIPYSMCDNSYDNNAWANAIKNKKITASFMKGIYYNHKKSTTAHGIDCSYFVYVAYRAAGASISYENTKSMLKSSNYRKISLQEMLPGDIFLKDGHVMMYVGKSGNLYAVFEADATDSKCSYNLYNSSVINQYKCYRLKYME